MSSTLLSSTEYYDTVANPRGLSTFTINKLREGDPIYITQDGYSIRLLDDTSYQCEVKIRPSDGSGYFNGMIRFSINTIMYFKRSADDTWERIPSIDVAYWIPSEFINVIEKTITYKGLENKLHNSNTRHYLHKVAYSIMQKVYGTPYYWPDVTAVEKTDVPLPRHTSGKGYLDDVLSLMSSVIDVGTESVTYSQLLLLADEAYNQAKYNRSINELPKLYLTANLPDVYHFYGSYEDQPSAILTMIGWITGMLLSELVPKKRTDIFKVAYEAGGYSMRTEFFGYTFKSDPNVARWVGGALYAAMRSRIASHISEMRSELGGSVIDYTVYYAAHGLSGIDFSEGSYYTDLREFMNSAPGPYADGYEDRSGLQEVLVSDTRSDENKVIDQDIYNYIVQVYNLDTTDATVKQRVVQAIADKDADSNHIFGPDYRDVHGEYNFNAVFGPTSFGREFSPNSKLANLFQDVIRLGSYQRDALQDAALNQYGRSRPGANPKIQGQRKSYTDNRLNILTNFWIENGDGHPTGYYNEHDEWVDPEVVSSPEEYEEMQRDNVYANSYPSGHSSGMGAGFMLMIELFPDKADVIMRIAYNFCINRTLARYHWLSDTIQGRVLGTLAGATMHALSDWNARFEEVKNEIS